MTDTPSGIEASSSLPNLSSLLRSGADRYIAELRTILTVCGLNLVGMLVLGGICMGILLLGAAAFAGGSGTIAIISGGLLMLAVMIGFVWFTYWMMLGLMQVLRSKDVSLGAKDALMQVRPRVWKFIGLHLVAGLVVVGALAAAAAVSSIVLVPLAFIGAMWAKVLAVLGYAVAIGATALTMSVWLSFASWIFLDGEHTVVKAIIASRRLVATRFWPIFWRVIGIGVAYGLASMAASWILRFIFGSLPEDTGTFFGQTISSLLSLFVFTPLMLSSLLSLYQSATGAAGAMTDTSERDSKLLKLLIILGALLVTAIFSLVVAFGPGIAKQVPWNEVFQEAMHQGPMPLPPSQASTTDTVLP